MTRLGMKKKIKKIVEVNKKRKKTKNRHYK